MKYKKLKSSKFSEGENPTHQNPLIGFDEETGKEKSVCYRTDSNRFFEHPYTGAVYPFNRMNKWRENI